MGRRAARPGSQAAAQAKAAPKAKAQAKAQPKAKAAAAAEAAPQAAAVPRAPALPLPLAAAQQRPQRASLEQVEVMVDTWHQKLLAEVKQASTKKIVLLALCLDEIQLCTALQRRLDDMSRFACTVVVDRQYFLGRTAVHQRPRLKELEKRGAIVMLASGRECGSFRGAMHMKVAAINDDVVCMGSCNWTFSALANQEICLRLQGPAAEQIQQVVSDVVRTALQLKDAE